MNFLRRFSLLICFTYGAMPVWAQDVLMPMIANVKFTKSNSPYLTDYDEKTLLLQITNPNTRAVNVLFEVEITSGSASIKTKPAFIESQLGLSLPANRTTPITQFELPVGLTNENNLDINIPDVARENLFRLGILPEGQYSYCINLYERLPNNAGIRKISSSGNCKLFSVNYIQPPVITPRFCNDNAIPVTNPQSIVFSWLPAVQPPIGSMIGYDTYLVEIPDGQDPQFFTNQAVDKEIGNVTRLNGDRPSMGTQFLYDVTSLWLLEEGKRYGLIVKARDLVPNSTAYFNNDGKSPACSFRYGGGTTSQTLSIACQYPPHNEAIPFRGIPLIVKFTPYSLGKPFETFHSDLTVTDADGKPIETKQSDDDWRGTAGPGPDSPLKAQQSAVGPGGRKLTEEDAQHLPVNDPLSKDFSHYEDHRQVNWAVSVEMTEGGKTHKADASSSFIAGMGNPVLNAPAADAKLPEGDVTFEFQTAQKPDENTLFPRDIVQAKNGNTGKYILSIHERCVLEVARGSTFKDAELVKRQDFKVNVKPASSATSRQQLIDSTYRTLSTKIKLTSGKYYWRVRWLTHPDGVLDGEDYAHTETQMLCVGKCDSIPPPPPPTLAGECKCKFPVPSGKPKALKEGDKFYIGGTDGYEVAVSKLNADNTGEGTVGFAWGTFKPAKRSSAGNLSVLPLQVKFTGVTINDDGVMMTGKVNSKQTNLSTPTLMPSIGNTPSAPKLPKLSELYSHYNDLSRYWESLKDDVAKKVNSAANSAGFGTPLGLTKNVAGVDMTIAFDNFVFTPQTAQFDALTVFKDMTDTVVVIPLGVRAACLSLANDSSCEQDLTLYLVEDMPLGDKRLRLKGGSDITKATHVRYTTGTGGGFKDMNIVAEYELPKAKSIPENGPVKATLRATTTDGFANWQAIASIDKKFKIDGLDDFEFQLSDGATYDHDAANNPAGLSTMLAEMAKDSVTKEALDRLKSPTWVGFFMPKLSVTIPQIFKTKDDKRPTIDVTNVLVDKHLGLTGSLGAGTADAPIIKYEDGSLDGWYLSLDHIGITFFDGTFVKAAASGKVGLPIADKGSALVYETTLSPNPDSKQIEYKFRIVPKEDINVPIWKASMKLAATSSISLIVTGSTVAATADLNGSIGFKADVGGPIPEFNLDLMEVQHLKIMSKAPYISVDELQSPIYKKGGDVYKKASEFAGKFASPQHSVAKFPVTIDDFSPVVQTGTNGTTKAGFYFHGSLDLSEDLPGKPKAGLGLLVLATVKMDGIRPSFTYDRTELEDVQLAGQLGPVAVAGELKFFKEDQQFGNGFKGKLNATFGTAKIEGQAIFGKSTFNYWYFYLAGINTAGLFQVGPVTVNGIGGGLYHNMTPPAPDPTQFSALKEGNYDYTPKIDTDGLKASIYFSVASQFVFNAKATLEGSMKKGALDIISLSGNGKLISGEGDNSLLQAAVKASYHFPQKIFTLDAGITGGVDNVLTVNGQLALKVDFEQEKYYLKIGEPQKRNTIKLFGGLGEATGYFMVGNSEIPDIPEPDPSIISKETLAGFAKVGYHGFNTPASGMPAPFDTMDAPGLAFGATLKLGKKIDFAIFWADLHAGAGVDINIRKSEVICEETRKPMGENGWYAKGQAYAEFYGGVGVSAPFVGDVKIVELKAAALLQAGLPNPSWFQGFVHGEAHVLGIFNGSFDLPVSLGEPCTPVSNPYSEKPLFAEFNIDAGNQNKVDILLNPQVRLNYPAKFSVSGIKADGGAFSHDYEIKVATTLSPTLTGEQYYNDDKVMYRMGKAFDPFKSYSIGFKAEAFEDGKPYYFPSQQTGKRIQQDTSFTFKTGPCIGKIEGSSLSYTFPYQQQAYYLQGENTRSTVKLKKVIGCLFDPKKVETEIVVTPYTNTPSSIASMASIPKQTASTTTSTNTSKAANKSSMMVNSGGAKVASAVMIGDAAFAEAPKPQGTPVKVPISLDDQGNIFYTMPKLPNNVDVRVEVVQRAIIPVSLLAFSQKSALSKSLYGENQYVSNKTMKIADTDQNKALAGQNAAMSKTFEVAVVRDTTSKKLTLVLPEGKVIFGYDFHTSRYNTLAQKLAKMRNEGDNVISLHTDHGLQVSFQSGEGFDVFDANDHEFDNNGKSGVNPALVSVAEENNHWYNETIVPLNKHWINLQAQLRKTKAYHNNATLELKANEHIKIEPSGEMLLFNTRVWEILDNRLAEAKHIANWVKASAADYHKWIDKTYHESSSTYLTVRKKGEDSSNPDHMWFRFLIVAGDNIDPLDGRVYPFDDFNYLKTNVNKLINFDAIGSLRAKLPISPTVIFGYRDPMGNGKTGAIRKTYTLNRID